MVVCGFWCGSVLESLPSLSLVVFVAAPWCGKVVIHGVWCGSTLKGLGFLSQGVCGGAVV